MSPSRWVDDGTGVAPTRVRVPGAPAASPSGTPVSPTDPGSLVNDPTADSTTQDTQSETAIVLGSGSNVASAFNDSGSYTGSNNHFTGWSSSATGGASWTDHGALPNSAPGDAGDPVLARSASTGTVFLTTLGFSSANNIEVFRSADNGTTFGAPVGAYVGTPSADFDKEWIAVDNYPGTGFGNVYVIARDFGSSNSIRFTRSLDDGGTWGPSGGLTIVSGQQGAFLAIGPDHSVYAFWFDSSSSPYSIKMRKSTDLGVSFGSTVTVTGLSTTGINGDLGLGGGFRSNAFPQVAINPVTGVLYVVYDDRSGSDKANVYLRQSIDGGATWSAAILVNNDGGANDQWQPSVAVMPNAKKLVVSWYDRRNDPGNNAIQRFAGVAGLSTGTPTFGREFPVSPPFPVVVGQDPVINTVYMGDYDMAAADNSGFYLTWGDNRDSGAFHAHQPDARFGKVLPTAAATDLSITQKVSAKTVNLGDPVTFTLTVTNVGPNTASWVNVADPISGPFAITSIATTAGGCAGAVGCVITSLASGVTATITINGTAAGAGTITSLAKVSHQGKDPVGSNDKAKKTVTVTGSGHTYSTDVDCAIPDNNATGVDCPLSVPDAGTLSLVNVSLRINHTYDGDLQISLVAPDATSVLLVNRRGGSGDNFGTGPNPCDGTTVYTTLSDGGSTPIGSGAAPFTGTFTPESPLSALNGHERSGTWKLHVADLAAADVGTVLCWQLVTN